MLAGIAAVVFVIVFLLAVGVLTPKLFSGGDYQCNRCGNRFKPTDLQFHAEWLGTGLSDRAAQAIGGDVFGSITIHKAGRAYCPECVLSPDSVRRIGRTVEHRPKDA